MGCNKFLEVGLLYFYGELEPVEKDKFEKHLGECEFCNTELNELKSTSELYGLLPREEPSPVVLSELSQRAKNKKLTIRIPSINIFQNLLRPVPIGIGIGTVIIFVILNLLQNVSQGPNHLEWEVPMSSEIETIEDDIYDYFHERDEILGAVDEDLLGTKGKIAEIRERIDELEKELQTLW